MPDYSKPLLMLTSLNSPRAGWDDEKSTEFSDGRKTNQMGLAIAARKPAIGNGLLQTVGGK